MQARAPAHLYAIDALRFLAAMVVLLHHWTRNASEGVKALALFPESLGRHGGHFGVALFFLISGFVILMSARGATARSFIAARVIRLYPAFWICCTVTWLATFAHIGYGFGIYAVNMTMFPGAASVPLIDGVYWTLAVEAKFYLLIAVLLTLGKLERIEPVLWGWMALSLAATSAPLRDLIMAEWAPMFIGGCACYLLRDATPSRWALFAVAMLAGAYGAVGHDLAEAVQWEVPPQPVMTAAVVASFYPLLLAVSRGWLRAPEARWIAVAGAMSYPLYLLHSKLGRRLFDAGEGYQGVYLVALVWVLGASWLVATYGEPPLKRWLKRHLAPQSSKGEGAPNAEADRASVEPPPVPNRPARPPSATA